MLLFEWDKCKLLLMMVEWESCVISDISMSWGRIWPRLTLCMLMVLVIRLMEIGIPLECVKGALIVMRAQWTLGDIYKLLGSIVVGWVTSVESDDNATILWLMCLGNLSKCGMVELHRKGLLKGVWSCKLDFWEYFCAWKIVQSVF